MYAFKNFVHMLMTPLAMASILAVAGAILRIFRLRRAASAALERSKLTQTATIISGLGPSAETLSTALRERKGRPQ